ncbi:MAG: hypothetical protein M3350_06730 [Actinomycetota bacterium]|nr:hypothetical protein [Actinomycetota bacterium]
MTDETRPVTRALGGAVGENDARPRHAQARLLAHCQRWPSSTPIASPSRAGWRRPGCAPSRPPTSSRAACPDPAAELGPFDRTLWITEDIGLWQTASLFVTREVFDRIGGFEDWLDVASDKLMAEDVWFGWRAQRAAARTAFAPPALAHHGSSNRAPTSPSAGGAPLPGDRRSDARAAALHVPPAAVPLEAHHGLRPRSGGPGAGGAHALSAAAGRGASYLGLSGASDCAPQAPERRLWPPPRSRSPRVVVGSAWARSLVL